MKIAQLPMSLLWFQLEYQDNCNPPKNKRENVDVANELTIIIIIKKSYTSKKITPGSISLFKSLSSIVKESAEFGIVSGKFLYKNPGVFSKN